MELKGNEFNNSEKIDKADPVTAVESGGYSPFPKSNIMDRERDRRTILTTHLNIFLYSSCFWIQTGTLPVSLNMCVSCIYIYDSHWCRHFFCCIV